MRRRLARSVVPAALATVTLGLAVGAAPALAADACPNAAIRAEQGAGGLPGCRGYEKVSPQDKGGFSVTRPDGSNFVTGNIANATVVVSGGDGISYVAGGATADPDSQSGAGISYRGARGADGWATTAISPPLGPPAMPVIGLTANPMISSDGTRSIVQTPAQIAPGAPPCAGLLCAGTIYLQDNATRTRKTIGWAPLGEAPALGNPEVAATTPSLDRVVFTDADVLVPGAIEGGMNLYEWIDDGSERGRLRLVGLDDQGEPFADGAAAGQGPSTSVNETRRSLSADGRRIFFTSGGQLYARLDGTTTVHVSASQRATPDPDGPQSATFWTAEEAHGSSVYFTSGEQLTDDSQASADHPDLYRYDIDARRLTDVTARAAGPADVLGVIGASDDGKTVYFGATAQLVAGQGEAGAWNVYRWTDDGSASGGLGLVTVLREPQAADDENNWLRELTRILPVQVSSNGRYLALLSSTPLTDQPTAGTIQVYRYDADTETVTCASCRPGGADPTASASFREIRPDGFRVVSDRGQVAFQSYDPLVAEDTNGQRDVYVHDDDGTHLISTGKSPELSTFMGMSVSGDDIFFATRQSLLGEDVDTLIDLYDARVGGGFAAKMTTAPCEGDACQGRPSPSQSLPRSGSSGFVGPGNLPEPKPKPKPKKLAARAKAGKGSRFSIRVTAPSAGTIKLTGTRITTVKRKVGKAGPYTLRVTLNAKAKRTLARTHRLKVKTKVAFAPKSGTSSSKTVALTVKGQK